MKTFKLPIFIFIVSLLSGCSWQESFVIINNTSSDIRVEYSLDKKNGLTIFEKTPELYKAGKSRIIDWEHKLSVFDLNKNKYSVSVVVSPGQVLRFGQLSNDNYVRYNQEFINGYLFNLRFIKIYSENDVTEISKEMFDNFFVKEEGFIKYVVE